MTDLITIFSNPSVLFVLKSTIIVVIFVYGIFSFVVLKQSKLMSETFNTSYGGFFRFLTLIHFVAVLAVFICALIIL